MLKMYVRRNKTNNIDEQYSVVLEGEGTISHELFTTLRGVINEVLHEKPDYIRVHNVDLRCELLKQLTIKGVLYLDDNTIRYNYFEPIDDKCSENVCYNLIEKELACSNVFSLLVNESDVHKQSEILLSNGYEYEIKRRDGKVEFIINW